MVPLAAYGDKVIIFSDQHKGARNGSDDFITAAPNYLNALKYYNENNFCFINLGDCEELWENTLPQIKKHNKEVFEAEKLFLNGDRFIKILGNHDLLWGNDPIAPLELKAVFDADIKIYEGIILTYSYGEKNLQICCTHGHQGDARSDGNWFSKFFVARIWAPLQSYLRINTNEPSNDDYKKTIHNEIMYEWSATQKDTLLITGHTHQPVFESLTHIERQHRAYFYARQKEDKEALLKITEAVKPYIDRFNTINYDYSKISPSYFNTGCCCFVDGDITGIELEAGIIRLIKWELQDGVSKRMVLEEKPLRALFD